MRRRTLLLSAGPCALGGWQTLTQTVQAADAWPAKPITLIVPFPAGGPTDVLGRAAGRILQDRLKQTVVVENRPGAGGNIGTALLPDVPTVAEQGFSGFDVPSWFGLIAPAGLPRDMVATLNRALVDGLKQPDVAERFAQIGAEPTPGTPEQFAQTIADENTRWGKVIRDARITPE